PTPAALQRLQAAVNAIPRSPAQQRPQAEKKQPDDNERSGRSAINSLIHRMTGRDEQATPPRKKLPPVQSQPAEDIESEERDRVEIPAFLRRQAN
ncbi:MAG: cell division protein FtsZ, partial [Paracoccaceae bacterium]